MYSAENIITLVTLGIILIIVCYLIYYLNRQNAPIRTTVVQFIGIVLFVPLVFLLAFLNRIDQDVLATLMGTFAGYVFGKSAHKGEWPE